MKRRRLPKPVPIAEFLETHARMLVEMLQWPDGAPTTPATPGWAMARLAGDGLAERREAHDAISGRHSRYRLTEAGRAKAEELRAAMGDSRRPLTTPSRRQTGQACAAPGPGTSQPGPGAEPTSTEQPA